MDDFFEHLKLPFYKKTFSFNKTSQSIYIYGPPGGGKTFLVQLFFATIEKNKLSEKVLRIHFQEFMTLIHESINYSRSKNFKNPLKRIAKDISVKYKLICFDELEIIDIADAMLVSKVFELLISLKINFIITSNYKPEDLYKNGLQRSQFEPFIDLIIRKMKILKINNDADLRRKSTNNKADNFFYPLNSKTKIEFENYFLETAGIKKTKSVRILSLGRELIFKKCANDSLFTNFKYICSYKFSPNDYIKISNKFKWIFIDNIPLLGRNRLNEIRRFIVLIDILYEKKSNVIMRADKYITNIFQIEEIKQPYMRTISRIIEMSSNAWLRK